MLPVRKRTCILNSEPWDVRTLLERTDLPGLVASSGICGKGYLGLPVAERWSAFAGEKGEKALVCLISGESAQLLMNENAGAVLLGVALTARCFGLDTVHMVSAFPLELPEEIHGIRLSRSEIPHTLSSGEETRVFAEMEGDIPITRPQPPYPVEAGLNGKPTLIHSAEFFAHLPYLLSGTDRNTKICLLTGDLPQPGFYEVELGTTLRDLLVLGGADPATVKALQLGGINGSILSSDELATPYSYESVDRLGRFFADGSVRVLSQDRCIVQTLCSSMTEAYRSSCGRCVFCREGLYQLKLLLEDLSRGKAGDTDVHLISDIAGVIRENAACSFGKICADMVLSAWNAFPEEIEGHVRGKCKALACPGMFTVHILPDKCSGCTECLSRCTAQAISGGEGLIHVVSQTRCTQCLDCLPCAQDAIVRAGLLKPAGPDTPVPVGSFVQKKKGLQRRTK